MTCRDETSMKWTTVCIENAGETLTIPLRVDTRKDKPATGQVHETDEDKAYRLAWIVFRDMSTQRAILRRSGRGECSPKELEAMYRAEIKRAPCGDNEGLRVVVAKMLLEILSVPGNPDEVPELSALCE